MAKKYIVANNTRSKIDLESGKIKIPVKPNDSTIISCELLSQAVVKGLSIVEAYGKSGPKSNELKKEIPVNVPVHDAKMDIEEDEVTHEDLAKSFIPDSLIKKDKEPEQEQEVVEEEEEDSEEFISEYETLTPANVGLNFVSMTSGKDLSDTAVGEFKRYEMEEFCKDNSWSIPAGAKMNEILDIIIDKFIELLSAVDEDEDE